MTTIPHLWKHAAALVVTLGLIALVAPAPWYETDRTQYQEIGRAVIQRDCSALHCFRPLVPAVLEQLPGPSLLKWKTYAVIANASAAVAVAVFAVTVGLGPPAALLALWLSGIGFGGLFTLFDPYSADPAMFVLGPLLTTWIVRRRYAVTGIVSAVGVLAKEFAAAPLWIATAAAVMGRRWVDASRTATLAFAVTTVWLLLQVALMVGFNNSYGGNPSANLFGGGYIVVWFEELGMRLGLTALFTEFGPLYLLAPVGLLMAPATLRQLAIAALPALAAFAYVQQPDRALWNFHFLVTPAAALALSAAPRLLVLAFFACFAVANLRLAAQLPFLPAARYALALSVVIAGAAAVIAWRSRSGLAREHAEPRAADRARYPRAYRWVLGASAVAAVFASLVLVDMAAHRSIQQDRGLNREGYRGEVLPAKRAGEVRVALAGGAAAFSPGVEWEQSLAFVTTRFLRQRWRWHVDYVPATVVDLSHPSERASDIPATLRAYAHLQADIVCLMTGHNDLPGARLSHASRRDSSAFRALGYLPVLPAMLTGGPVQPEPPVLPVDTAWMAAHSGPAPSLPGPGPCAEPWTSYCEAVALSVSESLARGQRVLVISEPYVSAAHVEQQRALAAMIADRYGHDRRVKYLDLGSQADFRDPVTASDGWVLTPRGIESFADGLFTGLYAMVSAS